MKYLKSIFFIFVFVFSNTGCQTYKKTLTDAELFDNELAIIIQQQSAIRKDSLLRSLQEEYNKALTLSNIGNLELLLENYELSDAEKQYAILNYFDRALLYMQISLLPAEKNNFLSQYVKNTLLNETGTIFMQLQVAENFLKRSLILSPNDESRHFQKRLISYANDRKIEYNLLRINDLNASQNMPDINYPVNDIPAFRNITEYHMAQSHNSPVFDTAKNIYTELNKQHGENMPLLLIKILYKSSGALTELYYNDDTLKKDFCMLMTELVRIYENEQLFNAMQNTYSLRSDMQQAVSADKNISAAMLEAAFKSEIAYQLAYLKMLSNIGQSPFYPISSDYEKTEQLSESRTKTLRLLFNDVLKSIR